MALKGKMGSGLGEWGSSVGAAVFVSLFLFVCISVVVKEGVYVKDCRGLGLCKVGIVS
jgi:hypothetical protein